MFKGNRKETIMDIFLVSFLNIQNSIINTNLYKLLTNRWRFIFTSNVTT